MGRVRHKEAVDYPVTINHGGLGVLQLLQTKIKIHLKVTTRSESLASVLKSAGKVEGGKKSRHGPRAKSKPK